jgi:hypothetical protein
VITPLGQGRVGRFARLTLLGLLVVTNAYSWNALGHRLIAQIAYDNLSRQAKVKLNRDNRAVDEFYQHQSFVNAATWLDSIRYRTHAYDVMHFIDIPFSDDGSRLPKPPTDNAITAVNQALSRLRDPSVSQRKKGVALRILIHVVGDLHQPLHAATRIRFDSPMGDHGGNFVLLKKNKVARNLHSYWDKGAGLLVGKRAYGNAWVSSHAKKLEARWPCKTLDVQQNPMHWAEESHALAVHTAYAIPRDGHLSSAYQRTAQAITEQRLAVAGCRLASLLRSVD